MMRILPSSFVLALMLAATFSACKKDDPIDPVPVPEPVKVGSYYTTATATAADLNAIVYGGATTTTVADLGTDALSWAFDGTDDYLEVPDAATLKTEAVTVAAWVKVTEAQNSTGIFFKSNGQGSYNEAYGMFTNEKDFVGVAASGTQEPVVKYLNYEKNTWYHVAVTASKDSVILYIDGTRRDAHATGFDLKHAPEPLLIGHYPTFDRYFKGTLSDIRVYGVALTTEQVREEFGPK